MSDARFRALFDHSSDPHLIFDTRGIRDCNDAAIRILGCTSRDQVLRLHPAELSPEYQPDGQRSLEKAKAMDALARTQGSHRFEWTHLSVSKEAIPVEVTLNPITVDGEALFVVVWHDLREQKRREAELAQLNEQLRLASVRLTNDLIAAAQIQQSFLPKSLPPLEALSFAWRYRPYVHVGGDFLDIRPLSNDRTLVFLLDVTGHGVSAALLSVSISHMLDVDVAGSTWALNETPGRIVERLNHHFANDRNDVQFFTMFCAMIEHTTGEVTYVSAGHPNALLWNPANRSQVRTLPSTGLPIGVLDAAQYPEVTVTLAKGERLLMVSDGITEAMDPARTQYGEERLIQRVREAPGDTLDDLLEEILADIDTHCGPNGPQDDISMLVLQYR